MLITRMTPRASEKPLARMKRSPPNAIPLMMSPSTRGPPPSPPAGRRHRDGAGQPGESRPPTLVLDLTPGVGPSAWLPPASLREVPRENGMAQELLRRFHPELVGARDRRQHGLVVRLVDLEDVQVVDRVVVTVHGQRPAGRDGELRVDDGRDKLLRVLDDPAGHGVGAHPGLLAVVGERLVDPMRRRVRRLAPVGRRLAAVRLLPGLDE